MASLWQKTLFYLGLVDEGAGQADDATGQAPTTARAPTQAEVRTVEAPIAPSRVTVPGRRIEPPVTSRRRISSDPSLAEAGVYLEGGESDGRSTTAPTAPESEVIVARTFTDAQLLADSIRERRSVVLDLRTTEPEMVRRLVDFSSGLTYALDGSMRKIAQGVILVSPPRVSLSSDERRRLSDLGLYEGPDVS